MNNGKFPSYCPACKGEESIAKDRKVPIDAYIKGELLRYWVNAEIIDLKFAVRFFRQQDRKIQELQFEELMQTEGMRKCPTCTFVIVKNEGCNYIRCPECKTEICWQTGLVAGKKPGQCGGGHSCHY